MTDDPFAAKALPMNCRLDEAGLQTQLARYGELSRHVDGVRRWPGLLEVDFRPGVDVELLAEAIATERECCPFFELSYDEAGGQLSITVEDPSHDAALDALRFALTPG
jgi:hypothetical protein